MNGTFGEPSNLLRLRHQKTGVKEKGSHHTPVFYFPARRRGVKRKGSEKGLFLAGAQLLWGNSMCRGCIRGRVVRAARGERRRQEGCKGGQCEALGGLDNKVRPDPQGTERGSGERPSQLVFQKTRRSGRNLWA